MKFKEYIEYLDASIWVSFKQLCYVSKELLMVLLFVPFHLAYHFFRCAFPFFNPLIDKFKLTKNDE